MTNKEREKLVEEIKFTMCDGLVRGFNYRYIAEKVLAIAEAAFAKQIEAAYEDAAAIIEQNVEASSSVNGTYLYPRKTGNIIGLEYAKAIRARATILASIPEPKEP